MPRLAYGWELSAGRTVSPGLIREFIRPAVRAIPPRMAVALGPCRIALLEGLGRPTVASQWAEVSRGLEIALATAQRREHDIALELLLCLGQALWSRLEESRRAAYWRLLDGEIGAGTDGEIDQDALQHKRRLLSSRYSAASSRRLASYGAASFAGTAAEYVHCLWHEVTVRTGRDFLPARELRRRLDLLSGWYPPGRGRRLFALPRRRPPPGAA